MARHGRGIIFNGPLLSSWAVSQTEEGPVDPTPDPPPAATTPSRFRWLEVWSDRQSNGGNRIAALIARDVVRETRTDFGDTLTFNVLPNSPGSASLLGGRVIRIRFTDVADDQEYAIHIAAPGFNSASNLIRVMCIPVVVWVLRNAGKMRTFSASGLVNYSFSLPSTTLEDALGVMTTYLTTRGITDIVVDTVEPTTLIDIEVEDVTPHEFLLLGLGHPQILCEWRAFRNGATNHQIRVARQINIGAPVPVIRTRHNMRSHVAQSDAKEMANVVRPRGAEVDGVLRGIEEMTATVDTVVGTTITFEENCVPFNGCMTGRWLVKDAGTFASVEIVDSIAPNQVIVSSATGISAGHTVMFRETSGSDGLDVTTLLRPASITDHGHIEKEYSLPSVRGYRNWAKNGGFRDFSSGDSAAPDHFTLIGAGTSASKVTDPDLIVFGTHAVRLTVSSGQPGMRQDMYVHRRAGRSKFFAYVAFSVIGPNDNAGIQFSILTTAGTAPSGGQTNFVESIVPTQGAGVWSGVQELVIPFDAEVAGINDYRIQILSTAGIATGTSDGRGLYVHAIMVVLAEDVTLPFQDNGCNVLRDATILKLQSHGEPLLQHEVSFLDLASLVSALRVTTGGNVRLVNPELGTDEQVRVMSYREVFHDPGASSFTLASRAQNLTERLAAA